MARALGAGSRSPPGHGNKLDLCAELGAELTISYRDEDFVERVRAEPGGGGANVIFDIMGAAYLDRNVDALAPDGRLVIIGMQGGMKGELNIGKLLGKRAGVIATALRSRPVSGPSGKSEIVAEVVTNVWPMIADGRVRPVIGAEFPIDQARAAHELRNSGEVSGKSSAGDGLARIQPSDAKAPAPTDRLRRSLYSAPTQRSLHHRCH